MTVTMFHLSSERPRTWRPVDLNKAEPRDYDRAADVLERAAEVLDVHGWTQNAWHIPMGETRAAYCAIGALNRARSEVQARFEQEGLAIIEAADTISRSQKRRGGLVFMVACPQGTGWIMPLVTPHGDAPEVLESRARHVVMGFNDKASTTVGEVQDVFREAAKELRNRSVGGRPA